jgi:hypothetical protein
LLLDYAPLGKWFWFFYSGICRKLQNRAGLFDLKAAIHAQFSACRQEPEIWNETEETAMIRIQGIPVVAARLANAQKAKSTQARNRRRRRSKIDAGGERPLAVHSTLHRKMKVA